MYCVNCGVRLADTEKKCPLCGTVPYHPDIVSEQGEDLYPKDSYPVQQMSVKGVMIIITTAFVIAALISLICDLKFSGGIVWSGYVIGALIISYCSVVLPAWFDKPNPVVFVPSVLGGVMLYLLYINLASGGNWFMSFALPVSGAFTLIVTAVITLIRYVKGGRLYIFGGASIALGGLSVLIEFLLSVTFNGIPFLAWSLYPLITLTLVGGMLIFLAIYPPARETMERKFFI